MQNRKRQLAGILWQSGLLRDFLRLPFSRNRKERYTAIGKKLVHLCNTMGATFIKLGQFLSTRRDLLPIEIVKELETLQDAAKPMAFSEVEAILKRELPDDALQEIIPTPIASASIAQVHRAYLKTGEEVCLKIQRPGIAEVFPEDLRMLECLGHFFFLPKTRKGMVWKDGINHFRRQFAEELNFLQEKKFMVMFHERNRKDPYILVPKVYDSLCTEHVIVMEYFPYTSIRDVKGMDTKKISGRLIHSYATQLFQDGFFHGDPHPGNLLITPEGQIVFLDFGNMGRLSVKAKYAMLTMFFGATKNSPRMIIDGMRKLYITDAKTDSELLEKRIQQLLDRYLVLSLKEIEVRTIAEDFFQLMNDFNLILPGNLVTVLRSMVLLEGVIAQLDTGENLLEMAKPVAGKLGKSFLSSDFLFKYHLDQLYDIYTGFKELPAFLVDYSRVKRKKEKGNTAVLLLAGAIFFFAFAYLFTQDHTILGGAGMAVTLVVLWKTCR